MAEDRGALFELICRCHGRTEPATLAIARDTGAWCEQVRRIRDAGLRLRRARPVLPADALQAAGLTQEQLASLEHRHRLPALLTAQADTLRNDRLNPAGTAALPRALRIQLRIHTALLDELARSQFDVVDQRIGLTPLRKLWAGWRTRP
jgi:phytoene synthase